MRCLFIPSIEASANLYHSLSSIITECVEGNFSINSLFFVGNPQLLSNEFDIIVWSPAKSKSPSFITEENIRKYINILTKIAKIAVIIDYIDYYTDKKLREKNFKLAHVDNIPTIYIDNLANITEYSYVSLIGIYPLKDTFDRGIDYNGDGERPFLNISDCFYSKLLFIIQDTNMASIWSRKLENILCQSDSLLASILHRSEKIYNKSISSYKLENISFKHESNIMNFVACRSPINEGPKKYLVEEAKYIHVNPPVHAIVEEKMEFYSESYLDFKGYISKEISILKLDQGSLFSSRGIMISDQNIIHQESIYNDITWEKDKIIPNGNEFTIEHTTSLIEGALYSYFPRWGENYFHWHMEGLSQLFLLRRLGIDKCLLSISGPLKDYQRNSLSFFEFENLTCEIKSDLVKGIEVFSSTLAKSAYDPPMILKNIFEEANNVVSRKLCQQEDIRAMYVSRGNSNRRRLLNEEELIIGMKMRGIKVIDPLIMSFEEQISSFRSSNIIISLFGAGLTNIIYCKKNTTIVEIRPYRAAGNDRCIWTLANILDLNYIVVFCNDGSQDGGGHYFDWSINLDWLFESLTKIM